MITLKILMILKILNEKFQKLNKLIESENFKLNSSLNLKIMGKLDFKEIFFVQMSANDKSKRHKASKFDF